MPEVMLGPLVAAIYEAQAAFLEPKLRELGVSWTAFQLLTAVYGAAGGASQAEIARRLGITPATLCEAVQQFVREGQIEQVPSTKDKRLKHLRLTAKGQRLMERVRRAVGEAEGVLSGGIAPAKLESTTRTLQRALANLERADRVR